MFIFNSSIGKKFIQSISGAFLIIFLLLHGTINFFSVIDTFTGKFGAPDGLFQKGCDFMALPIVDIMVPVLALGFLVHIGYGCWLTWQNVRARGGVKRYEVSSKAAADSWSARNMFVLGLVILGLLFFHLSHFWAKMQLQEFLGEVALPVGANQLKRSPGTRYRHYAPTVEVRVWAPGEAFAWPHAFCYMGVRAPECEPAREIRFAAYEAYAHGLFSALRELESSGLPIVAEWPPEAGLGRALRDRISRAAGLS